MRPPPDPGMPAALLIARLSLQSVAAAAMLSLLLGQLAGPWGWVVGAVAGLVLGPFGKLRIGGWSTRRVRQEEGEEKREGSLGSSALVGCLVGLFASLPFAGLTMLVWFSVAQSPWGSGAWSATGVRGVTFSSSDPAMLWTFGATIGGCGLLGSLALSAAWLLERKRR